MNPARQGGGCFCPGTAAVSAAAAQMIWLGGSPVLPWDRVGSGPALAEHPCSAWQAGDSAAVAQMMWLDRTSQNVTARIAEAAETVTGRTGGISRRVASVVEAPLVRPCLARLGDLKNPATDVAGSPTRRLGRKQKPP